MLTHQIVVVIVCLQFSPGVPWGAKVGVGNETGRETRKWYFVDVGKIEGSRCCDASVQWESFSPCHRVLGGNRVVAWGGYRRDAGCRSRIRLS